MDVNKPSVSIIIPTLNEQEYVGRLLGDIGRSAYSKLEVIVSDNDSTDNTLKVAESYHKIIPNLELVTDNKRGVSRARNNGAKHANGEYLIFLDADSRILDSYIENSMMEMQEKNIDIGNHYITPISSKPGDKLMTGIINMTLKMMQYITAGGPGSGGIIIKKKIHDDIDGFDEKITKIGEDVDYQHRASQKGKFRMLKSEKTYLDMRRFDKEGRIKVWTKWAGAYAMHLSRMNMKLFPAKYTFGSF